MTDDVNGWGATLQQLIDTGAAWRMDGYTGRQAMAAIEAGECVLPLTAHRDYWGNRVPARTDLAPDTLGTIGYANRLRAERGDPLLTERPDGTVCEGGEL